ncbi:hypothetical protein ILUMI_11387 [Ignelater luminosus]|uniref:Reverse transcriptase RNase H-like domain-containing protein n=1 Tax=Ignelater luminosus TaxID=2038154 RepID=A0A8K0D084_IGNLU|nr:hypothetical protein ILUMI_11387 [Ignelater luminosus]
MTYPFVVSEYLDILKAKLNDLGRNDKPELIWNLNETCLSHRNEDCNPEMYEENNADRQQEVAPGKWLLVKYCTKQKVKHFDGQVTKTTDKGSREEKPKAVPYPNNLIPEKKRHPTRWSTLTKRRQNVIELQRSLPIRKPSQERGEFQELFAECGLPANYAEHSSDTQLDEMLAKDIIEETEPPWAAPVILTIEREALAVVWAINKFRGYIERGEVQAITDHQPLRWLMTLKSPSGRLTNVVTDSLSQPPCVMPTEMKTVLNTPELESDKAKLVVAHTEKRKAGEIDMQREQLSDFILREISKCFKSDQESEKNSPELKEAQLKIQLKNQNYTDSKRREDPGYIPGEMVWVTFYVLSNAERGFSAKFASKRDDEEAETSHISGSLVGTSLKPEGKDVAKQHSERSQPQPKLHYVVGTGRQCPECL